MADLGVEFIGFEFPGKRLSMTLEECAPHEAAAPDTFSGMYQFWIRKP
jgi:hypothetical protein